jgi:tetratricopeptide (TPR) repeat protein
MIDDEPGKITNEQNNRTDVASDLREVNAGLRRKSQKAEKLSDIEQEKNVKVILNRGLREMRERNYFRAISEFNHALEMSPGHPKASFYLNKANDELNSVIEQYNLSAMRDLQSLQYRKALVSYCSILRLLHNFSDSLQYKETQKKIEEVNKVLEIDPSENSCH